MFDGASLDSLSCQQLTHVYWVLIYRYKDDQPMSQSIHDYATHIQLSKPNLRY